MFCLSLTASPKTAACAYDFSVNKQFSDSDSDSDSDSLLPPPFSGDERRDNSQTWSIVLAHD